MSSAKPTHRNNHLMTSIDALQRHKVQDVHNTKEKIGDTKVRANRAMRRELKRQGKNA